MDGISFERLRDLMDTQHATADAVASLTEVLRQIRQIMLAELLIMAKEETVETAMHKAVLLHHRLRDRSQGHAKGGDSHGS